MQILMAVDGVAVLLNPLHILRTFARNWVWRIGAVARGINKLAAGILAVITWDAVGLSALVLCPVGTGPHLKRRTCVMGRQMIYLSQQVKRNGGTAGSLY